MDSLGLLLPSLAGLGGHGRLLVPLETEAELVQGPRHLSQGDDQLLVIGDGYLHHNHNHHHYPSYDG